MLACQELHGILPKCREGWQEGVQLQRPANRPPQQDYVAFDLGGTFRPKSKSESYLVI